MNRTVLRTGLLVAFAATALTGCVTIHNSVTPGGAQPVAAVAPPTQHVATTAGCGGACCARADRTVYGSYDPLHPDCDIDRATGRHTPRVVYVPVPRDDDRYGERIDRSPTNETPTGTRATRRTEHARPSGGIGAGGARNPGTGVGAGGRRDDTVRDGRVRDERVRVDAGEIPTDIGVQPRERKPESMRTETTIPVETPTRRSQRPTEPVTTPVDQPTDVRRTPEQMPEKAQTGPTKAAKPKVEPSGDDVPVVPSRVAIDVAKETKTAAKAAERTVTAESTEETPVKEADAAEHRTGPEESATTVQTVARRSSSAE